MSVKHPIRKLLVPLSLKHVTWQQNSSFINFIIIINATAEFLNVPIFKHLTRCFVSDALYLSLSLSLFLFDLEKTEKYPRSNRFSFSIISLATDA